jgi:hypothetical protein
MRNKHEHFLGIHDGLHVMQMRRSFTFMFTDPA